MHVVCLASNSIGLRRRVVLPSVYQRTIDNVKHNAHLCCSVAYSVVASQNRSDKQYRKVEGKFWYSVQIKQCVKMDNVAFEGILVDCSWIIQAAQQEYWYVIVHPSLPKLLSVDTAIAITLNHCYMQGHTNAVHHAAQAVGIDCRSRHKSGKSL